MTEDCMSKARFFRYIELPVCIYDAASVAGHIMKHVFPEPLRSSREEMWVVLINDAEQMSHESLVTRGTLKIGSDDIASAFRTALDFNARQMIVTHNHLSGDPTPSEAEVRTTQRFRAAGGVLEIPILDHIIVAQDSWYSMAEHAWSVSST